MSNKNKLRTELTNLYGGTNKFLTNAEITTIVNKYNGSNAMNVKKQAYKQAYSKYYNHVFGDILHQAFMKMKSSPQCPTGVNSEPIRKSAERYIQKHYGTGTTQGAKGGAIIGGAIGGGVGRGINVVGGGAVAAARGVARTAGALVQLCKGNPTHPNCNGNGNNQNRKQNGKQNPRKSERQKTSPKYLQNYNRN